MSTIDSLFGNTAGTTQINPAALANQGIIGAAGNGNNANSFDAAIAQALAQIGVVPPVIGSSDPSATGSSTTPATTAETAQQALQTFLNDLFSNIHDQSSSNATNSASNSGVGATHGHHHHHGGGGGLDNLIQELDASDSAASDSLITDSLSGNTTTSSSGISSLQQDFQNLLSSVGASSNQVSLSDFLKTVSNNLHTAKASSGTATV